MPPSTHDRRAFLRGAALLGLAEGEFPLAERELPLLREAERAALRARGLAGLEPRLRGEEVTLFYEAVTRAGEQLWLSRPYLADDGQPWEPSAYWRQVQRLLGEPPEARLRAEDRLPPEQAASIAEWIAHGYAPAAVQRHERRKDVLFGDLAGQRAKFALGHRVVGLVVERQQFPFVAAVGIAGLASAHDPLKAKHGTNNTGWRANSIASGGPILAEESYPLIPWDQRLVHNPSDDDRGRRGHCQPPPTSVMRATSSPALMGCSPLAKDWFTARRPASADGRANRRSGCCSWSATTTAT